jgi:hypothetical protein
MRLDADTTQALEGLAKHLVDLDVFLGNVMRLTKYTLDHGAIDHEDLSKFRWADKVMSDFATEVTGHTNALIQAAQLINDTTETT